MGTIYYVACDDSKIRADLDKFYSWSAYLSEDSDYADLDRESLDEYKEGFWVYRALRLHFFLAHHQFHRVGVTTEHNDSRMEYKEVMPWPAKLEGQCDEIDFTDPKADRLIIKTKYGEIFLDVREDGLNCFRHTKE